jgi:thiamine biosynthesis lipoprotein
MLHRFPFRAMGCQMLAILEQDAEDVPGVTSTSFTVRAAKTGGTPVRDGSASLNQVPEWFEEWEQTLSRFRYDSELSRLNRTTDQPVPVSQTLWDVFQASLHADQTTGGLVTPTVLDAIVMAGYDRPFDKLPANTGYPTTIGYTDLWTEIQPLSMVISDEETRSICLPPNVHLDFGGIAKGWVAHQAAERLKVNGPALMNAGGDISISGPRLNGEAWLIGISNPFEPDQDLVTLHLQDGGVATSGKDRRRWMQGASLNHHIIDPRTGLPAVTDVLTATVIAPTVMEAEAAAKSVFLLGSGAGLEWLEADSGLAAILVLDHGQVLASSRVEEYL